MTRRSRSRSIRWVMGSFRSKRAVESAEGRSPESGSNERRRPMRVVRGNAVRRRSSRRYRRRITGTSPRILFDECLLLRNGTSFHDLHVAEQRGRGETIGSVGRRKRLGRRVFHSHRTGVNKNRCHTITLLRQKRTRLPKSAAQKPLSKFLYIIIPKRRWGVNRGKTPFGRVS